MYGHGSKDRYPNAASGKGGAIPKAEANASNGKLTGKGSSDSYPSSKKGNTFQRPNQNAKASAGTVTGHGSKTSYPNKSGAGSRDQFKPKGANKL